MRGSRSGCGRRRGWRRVVLGTRVSPTPLRRWRRSSEGARSGGGSGLGRSGMRVVRTGRIWLSRSRSGRGRRRGVLVPPVSPTPVRHWRRSSERARNGGGCGWRRSPMTVMPPGGLCGRRKPCGRRGGWRRVVLGTRASPTPVRRWGRSSEGARSGDGSAWRRSGLRVVPGVRNRAIRSRRGMGLLAWPLSRRMT